MQRDLFPAATALPTPDERTRARDHVSATLAMLLYLLFALVPGTVCALSIDIGETYGEGPYRFLVSWLFFWVAELLTLDPFVTRYRRQLIDVVQHWRQLLKCTQTALFVCFEHGFLYYALLWSVAYVFVFIEAGMLLFAHLSAASDLTTLLFIGTILVFVVAWLGRIVESHGLIAAARQQPRVPLGTGGTGGAGAHRSSPAADFSSLPDVGDCQDSPDPPPLPSKSHVSAPQPIPAKKTHMREFPNGTSNATSASQPNSTPSANANGNTRTLATSGKTAISGNMPISGNIAIPGNSIEASAGSANLRQHREMSIVSTDGRPSMNRTPSLSASTPTLQTVRLSASGDRPVYPSPAMSRISSLGVPAAPSPDITSTGSDIASMGSDIASMGSGIRGKTGTRASGVAAARAKAMEVRELAGGGREIAVGGGVQVRLADGPTVQPDVQLDADAHLDLVAHLERNRRQMTVDHNTVTVELSDQLSRESGYRWYRGGLWLALVVFGGGSLTLVLRESYNLWPMSVWADYGLLAGLMVVVMLTAWYGGQRFADPTFLQMFLLLGITLPIVYGNWLLTTYAELVRDATQQQLPWTTFILVLHMILTQLYWMMMQGLVTRLSAPSLYARFMMLPLLLSYVFQYVIFGFTPWSIEFVLVLVLTSLHNVLASTGLYLDAWALLRRQCIGSRSPTTAQTPHPAAQASNSADNSAHHSTAQQRRGKGRRACSPEEQAVRSFRRLLETRHTMQVFALDTVADVWSFIVIVWFVFVLWAVNIPIDTVLPSFTVDPLTLRLSVVLFVRGLAWVSGQLVFRRKLQDLSQRTERHQQVHGPLTLADQLELYLASLRRSAFETALIRACYEEDAPELFAHISNADAALLPSFARPSGSLAELLLLQIAERQWLLHPALLRKSFLYFHACMYYLLFIILQSAPGTAALRYAWFRQQPNIPP